MSEDDFTPIRIHPDPKRITEGGSVRFDAVVHGVARPAFAVRWRGRFHAYLNVCRHQARMLDFGDGHFFDDAYDALVCCHHGARYRPDDGACLEGPCEGGGLTALQVEERDGALWCVGVRAAS